MLAAYLATGQQTFRQDQVPPLYTCRFGICCVDDHQFSPLLLIWQVHEAYIHHAWRDGVSTSSNQLPDMLCIVSWLHGIIRGLRADMQVQMAIVGNREPCRGRAEWSGDSSVI